MATFSGPRRYGSSGRFEVISWYFMRVSGAVLLLIAVFHLLVTHIGIGVDNIDFNLIVTQRWNGPLGAFWRLYDLTLLFFAMIHGANGARWVIDDYVHRPGVNLAIKAILYVVIFVVILMGAQVIFTIGLA